jgi:hypothetical protein
MIFIVGMLKIDFLYVCKRRLYLLNAQPYAVCMTCYACVLQAAVERDAAQSRADELSLDLNAARREVAALRSQLARQQQDIIQLKLQLAQAAASAAAAAAVGSSGGASRGGSLGGRPGSPLGRSAAAAAAVAAAATAALPARAQWQQQQQWSAGGPREMSMGFGSPQQQQQGGGSLGGAAGSSGGVAEESKVRTVGYAVWQHKRLHLGWWQQVC